jgi:LAO/AO transport system kinase
MKAGVMEVPDLVLVTKGDLGAPARRAAAEARVALSLGAGEAPGVALISARTGDGIPAALDAIAALAATRRAGDALAERREAQGRAWAESRLVESIGRLGFGLLASELASAEAPFAGVARASRRVRRLLHQILEED